MLSKTWPAGRLGMLSCLLGFAIGFGLLPTTLHGQSSEDEYAVAATHYERGNWKAAIEGFKGVIQYYPNTPHSTTAHFFLGEAYLQVSEHELAFDSFQGFLKRIQTHELKSRATFRLGETAFRLNRYDQAIRLLETFALEYPDHSLNEFGLVYLGDMRIEREEPQLAMRAYETALKAYPESKLAGKCRLGLARALYMLGQHEEASRFLQFIADTQDHPTVGEAQLQLGIISFGRGQFETARNQLGIAMASCSSDQSVGKASYWLARTELELGNHERAVRLFEEASRRITDDHLAAAILFDGSIAAIKSDNFATAESWLRELRKRWPDSDWADDALKLQIDIAFEQKRFRDALDLAEQFDSRFSDSKHSAQVRETVGRVLYEQKNYSQAIDVFRELVASTPKSTPGVTATSRATWKYFLGLSHLGLEQYASAINRFDSIPQEVPSEDLRPLVEVARGSTLLALGEHKSAVSAYRNYLAMDPRGADANRARSELCFALAAIAYWDEADRSFNQLQAQCDDRRLITETAVYLAEAAYADNQNQLAEKWYTVMSDRRNDPETIARGLSGLAWIRMRSDQDELAMETFQRLLREYPDSEYAAEAAIARARYLDENQDYREAAKMYGLVIERFPGSRFAAVAKLRQALAYQALGGRDHLRQAKELLTDYLQTPGADDSRDEAIYQLGWILYDLDLAHHGREKFQQIVDHYPNSKFWPDAAYRLASFHVQQKNYEPARRLLALLVDDQIPFEILSRSVYLRGQIAAEENDWESVAETMQQLLEKTDDAQLQANAQYWLAESHYRQGRYAEAEGAFESLVHRDGSIDSALVPWIQLRRAQCASHGKDWETAMAIADQSLIQHPDFKANYELHFIRGRALATLGRLDDARDAFTRVVNSSAGGTTETAAIAQWRIGETFFHQEKYVEAIGAFHRVDALFSYPKWRAAALLQAAKCQEHLGNWKHAQKLYSQLIDSFPDSEFRSEAELRLAKAVRSAQRTRNQKR